LSVSGVYCVFAVKYLFFSGEHLMSFVPSIITLFFLLSLAASPTLGGESEEQVFSGISSDKAEDPKSLYLKNCSECHQEERYGLSGPPLLPEYFGRKKKDDIRKIINNGLPATNMPPFRELLKEGEIDSIVEYITTPVQKPVWAEENIISSLQMADVSLDDKAAVFDMTNFFMVVEGGLGMVHFMDGETFTPRGSVRVGAIHGGPKFGRDLRYAYAVARDGWIIKYDMIALREVARVRGGISSRNIALSSDGRYLAQANLLPKNIVIFDTLSMKPKEIVKPYGTPGAVYDLKKRKKFAVSIKDKPKIIMIDESRLSVDMLDTDQPFTDFFIDPEERYLVGTSRGSDHLSVLDILKLKVVRKIKAEGGMPHLASAALWSDENGRFAAFPNIGSPVITVIDMKRWGVRGKIETKGPGFFVRTHQNIPHLWVDTGTDTIQLIDKTTLKVVKEIVPKAGNQAMHIEFDKEGRHALVSVWEDEGEVVIYDTKTFELVKRLPFRKPVGKYNATNKRF